MDAKFICDEQNISILKKDKIQPCTCKTLPHSPPPQESFERECLRRSKLEIW